ncbi:hypothetical protein GLW08_14820 [Pontibacillus yanchengensis]|uniref:Uncharacterized protein n=2 Tax=Pontibacillus yanchengensis TaxID=462910 RepID=A0ACC7VI39_9BACI|nr:hypothetical protein [Pontibacillus yanchengensis]MYL35677.1 hypothetical protein [Pontibacillus yanchengensis]MYL54606.1 hypothetical protein [Pontibacillus yanchengensis]
MLEVTRATEYDLETFTTFFGEHANQLTEQQQLYTYGHYVEIHHEKKGFFALVPVDNHTYWLRTLYLTPDMNPNFILTLFEVLHAYIEENGMENVYVHCHQPALRTLLEAQQFTEVDDAAVPQQLEAPVDIGGWWKLCQNVKK